MSLWTWFGLHEGNASTTWPDGDGPHGQARVLGMPRFDPARCEPDCGACADACVTHAITMPATAMATAAAAATTTTTVTATTLATATAANARAVPEVDWGRCIVCQRCTEVCPSGAFSTSEDWAVAVTERDDLAWRAALDSPAARTLQSLAPRSFRRSLHIRHVDAGSCNGCESELQALDNPFYNLHRLGVFFTASPRFADVLMVTGTVTHAMRPVLAETYAAMPDPKWVIAAGTCAVSGGLPGGNYACGNGLDGVLPVDIYLPGCPPNPAALIHALLIVVGRAQQQMRGGRLGR